MRRALAIATALGTLTAGACAPYEPSRALMDDVYTGDLGRARAVYAERARESTGTKDELLTRLKAMLLAMGDGVPASARPNADRVYEILRTQGVNEGTGLGTAIAGERASRTWKGEPFEQAMAYHQIAVLDALAGDWDNTRASANNALFLLEDFSSVTGDSTGIAAREAVRDAAPDAEGLGVEPERVVSDFEPGYVMKAIACRRLGLTAELDETIDRLLTVAPHLSGLAERIRSGAYDTVIVVDFGMAPEKVAAGDDGVLVDYRPRTSSDNTDLIVRTSAGAESFPVVTDLNRLASDLKWNNLEDVRQAKALLGTALIAGGVGVAALSDDEGAQLAGLGTALAGALLKSTASADTRHCEILPQRTYIALASVSPGERVELEIEGRPGARLALEPTLAFSHEGDTPDRLRAIYVRLPGEGGAWTDVGAPLYANDHAPGVPGADLPWILGGRCVRTPTWDVVRSYQDAGRLPGLSVQALEDLYRDEGITIAPPDMIGPPPGVHILEGGDWLFTPAPGSTGFARLYAQEHLPYRPRSERLRALADQLRSEPRPDIEPTIQGEPP